MMQQEIGLLGITVGEYLVEELIGEGSFSWVYRGLKSGSTQRKALKMAKPPELAEQIGQTGAFATEALIQATGWCSKVVPNAYELLYHQATKLQVVADPILVEVEAVFHEESSCHYSMELIEGRTLRDLISSAPIPVELFRDLAIGLDRLTSKSEFAYHGDLKPDNILVTPTGVKIIDPGYYGPLELAQGNRENVVVTTPSYYPLLEPDDLLAFGLIFWEAAVGQQPLAQRSSSASFNLQRVGTELLQRVRAQEAVGRSFLSPMLGIHRPSTIRRDLSPALDSFLLKVLGLTVSSKDMLETTEGFSGFGELANAIDKLLQDGLVILGGAV